MIAGAGHQPVAAGWEITPDGYRSSDTHFWHTNEYLPPQRLGWTRASHFKYPGAAPTRLQRRPNGDCHRFTHATATSTRPQQLRTARHRHGYRLPRNVNADCDCDCDGDGDGNTYGDGTGHRCDGNLNATATATAHDCDTPATPTATATATPTASPARAVNLSTRVQVQTATIDDWRLIITGNAPKKVVVRGPAITGTFGISNSSLIRTRAARSSGALIRKR